MPLTDTEKLAKAVEWMRVRKDIEGRMCDLASHTQDWQEHAFHTGSEVVATDFLDFIGALDNEGSGESE